MGQEIKLATTKIKLLSNKHHLATQDKVNWAKSAHSYNT